MSIAIDTNLCTKKMNNKKQFEFNEQFEFFCSGLLKPDKINEIIKIKIH